MGVKNTRMKKFLLIILTLSLISFVFWNFRKKSEQIGIQTQTIRIGTQKLSVEIARTIPQITLGLGQRDSLGSDGMLFVMPIRSTPSFWMKDMQFDLDFVWIDTNIVVDLTENVSAQRGEPDSRLRIYSPRFPVTHVLEMNSGEVKKLGIKIGDVVQM